MTEDVSYKIIKHSNFSWSYVYIIDDKKRDIHGSSVHDLKRKVSDKGLPWDYENFPEDEITESKYDSMKFVRSSKRSKTPQYNDETYDYEESQKLRGWNPSSKKWNRKKDIRKFYE